MSENVKVTKRAGTIGFFTLLSRITGLLRESVVAYFFGTGVAADAFYMAFTIPNLLRRFVAEGALTIAFIPVFTREYKRDKVEAKTLSDQAFTYLLIILLLLTALGIFFSGAIIQLVAGGFHGNPEKFALTVRLTRLCFPYILFVSLAALVMGVLNSLKRFASSAASPILFNLGLIGGAAISPWFDPPVLGLAVGVVAGGFLQLAVQFPDLKQVGYFPRLHFGVHPELKKLLGLMLPAAYGAAVYQLNVIVLRFFASYLPTGAVSYLWYASRLFEFPMGVFAIAMATAIQPTLSDFAADQDWDQFKGTLRHGLRMNLLITVPAMVGLIVLAEPLVRVLLQRGAFDPASAQATGECIAAFAVGLPFLGMVRILVPAFYSIHDAKTPLYIATLAVGVNLLLAYCLVGPWQHTGLALAVSLSSMVNAAGLLLSFRQKQGAIGIRSLLQMTFATGLASTLMGLLLWLPIHQSWWLQPHQSFWLQSIQLLVAVGGGIVVYFGCGVLLQVKETREAATLFLKKFRG